MKVLRQIFVVPGEPRQSFTRELLPIPGGGYLPPEVAWREESDVEFRSRILAAFEARRER